MDFNHVDRAMKGLLWKPTSVLSGCAYGADMLGEQWASRRGLPISYFPANWQKFKKAAGFKRNEQMADQADALVALWDGESRGTLHMIETARSRQLLVVVYEFKTRS